MYEPSRRGPRAALRIGAATCALAAAAATAPAFAADPKGNNGTIKIDDQPFDTHPNNQPHVGCVFQVDFYGFDKGNLTARVTFRGQAPTGKGILLERDFVPIGEDAAGGGTDLDAERTYDLTSVLPTLGEPHPKRGYHIKLTVNAPGSKGADTKHKVFWVQPCELPPPPPPPPPHDS